MFADKVKAGILVTIATLCVVLMGAAAILPLWVIAHFIIKWW